MKICTKCSIEKALGEFGARRSAKDGLQPWCRACASRYAAAYYAENTEKIIERSRAWYVANPELAYEARRKWAAENPAACREYSRKYYEANIAARSEYHRAYSAANSERIIDRSRKWAKANPEKRTAGKHRRRAKEAGADGTHTAADVKQIKVLQRSKCANCRCSIADGYHVDHVHPLSKGGGNDRHNLQLLCPRCNLSKHAKLPEAFAREQGRLI